MKNREIQLQGGIIHGPQDWEAKEVLFLLKYYPKYKSGNSNYNGSWIRGHLKSRTLAAISKKYWTLVGRTTTTELNPNQQCMPFLFERLDYVKD